MACLLCTSLQVAAARTAPDTISYTERMTHFFMETALAMEQACLQLHTVDNGWVSVKMGDCSLLKIHCSGTKRARWPKIAFIQLVEGQPESTCWTWSRNIVTELWEIKVMFSRAKAECKWQLGGKRSHANQVPQPGNLWWLTSAVDLSNTFVS